MKTVVIKRDGSRVPYDAKRIVDAVLKAAEALGVKDNLVALQIAQQVTQRGKNKRNILFR